jgi:uncharacterized protein (DUF4415 family)
MKESELKGFVLRGLVSRIVAYKCLQPVTLEPYFTLWFYGGVGAADEMIDFDSNLQDDSGVSVSFSMFTLVNEFVQNIGLDPSIITVDTSLFDKRKMGGSRPGAGRHKAKEQDKKIMISVRLDPDIVEWLRGQDCSQSESIETAIREKIQKFYTERSNNEAAEAIQKSKKKDKFKNDSSELSRYLTVRTATILASVGILTLEHLANANDNDLLKLPNFGKRQLAECMGCLEAYYFNDDYQQACNEVFDS